jgi:hypothetical protein
LSTKNVCLKNKEDWIFKYGSDLLQQSLMAGYDCKDRYLQERIALDWLVGKLDLCLLNLDQ